MAVIPRSLLGKPKISADGRRNQALPGANEGVDQSIQSAILQHDRGIDLAPLADGLVQAGSMIAEAEAKRKAYEMKLQQVRDETSVELLLMNTTTRTKDLYESLKAEGIEDPQKAREAWNSGMREIVAGDERILAGLGPQGQRMYTERIAKMHTEYSPQLTGHAIQKTKENLIEKQRATLSASLNFIGSTSSDSEAAAIVDRHTDMILKAPEYGTMTEQQAKHLAKWYQEESIIARFNYKARDDFDGAMTFLRSQPMSREMQQKMITRAYQIAKGENDHESMMLKAAEAEEKRASDEMYKGFILAIDKAKEEGDMSAFAEIRDAVQAAAPSMEGEKSKLLFAQLEKAVEGDRSKDFTSPTAFVAWQMAMDQDTPVKNLREYMVQNKQRLNSHEMNKLSEEIAKRERMEYGRAEDLEGEVLRELQDDLAAFTPEGALFDPENIMGGQSQLNRKFRGMMSQASQTLRVLKEQAMAEGGLQFWEHQRYAIKQQVLDMYRPVVESSYKKEAGIIGGTVENLEKAMFHTDSRGQFTMDPHTRMRELTKYERRMKVTDPTWSPETDPFFLKVKAREQALAQASLEAQAQADALAQEQAALAAEATEALRPEVSQEVIDTLPEEFRVPVDPADIPTGEEDVGIRIEQSAPPRPQHVSEPVYDAITRAAFEEEIPLDIMMAMADIETGGRFDPNAKNPNSSASGLYQFIDSTAEQYGIEEAEKRFDPYLNAKAAAELFKDNLASLERRGIEPEPWMLYAMHQQGAGGFRQLLALAESGEQPSASLQRRIDLNMPGRKTGHTPAQLLDHWKAEFERRIQKYQ